MNKILNLQRIPLPRYKRNDSVVWLDVDDNGELIRGGLGTILGGYFSALGRYNTDKTLTGWYYYVETGSEEAAEVKEENIMNSV